ncbi:aspartate kinase [Methanospirillum sp. J.3.6.1-F.2.7.3]|uniref:Aspartokinase n=3 Tax=Methanospirillum TaxID=2202 RepID=A0A8E7B3X3_9EURY|nr:aspartate kinase [Methanospirillum sp. J.3.6.1-F.2.7.3]QXO96402.1 aspartate kinase [Methanospirillum hungatei]
MKFGGTSVQNAESVRRAIDIVYDRFSRHDHLAVVVSAKRGVTDRLISCAEAMVTSRDAEEISDLISFLIENHLTTLQEVAPDFFQETSEIITRRIENLRDFLYAVYHLRELTVRSRDYIISFGERLNAPIISAALRQRGIPSMVLDGCEAGILTTENHGDAIALPAGETRIKTRLEPIIEHSVPVITGFMGCTEKGVVTTLGRSGSDYSATIIGAALDADEIWIWTDVDGIMTTDPRMVPEARVISRISYIEVMELSYFGAKVMHSRSIEPAMQKGIPVWVKNTFNPDYPGTVIEGGELKDSRVVKAITYIDKVAAITITGAQMVGRPGVARHIFTLLAEHQINVMMISQGSSEANITLIIEAQQVKTAMEALLPLKERCVFRDITANEDVCAVAVVGSGMAGMAGTAGRTFSALGKAGINVMMISQGSSEVNISFVVRQQDGPLAVRILHDEFNLMNEEV